MLNLMEKESLLSINGGIATRMSGGHGSEPFDPSTKKLIEEHVSRGHEIRLSEPPNNYRGGGLEKKMYPR